MASLKEMRELLDQSRREGDRKKIANLAYRLGDTYRERGDREKALPLLEESLLLCRQLDNPIGEAIVLVSLATLHLQARDALLAETHARAALEIYRRQAEAKGIVKASMLLGDACWAGERYEEALPLYREALEICRAHQDIMGTAALLDRVAKMLRLLDRHEEALPVFEEALDAWHRLSVPDREAMTLVNMGDLYRRKRELRKALLCHEQALDLFRDLKDAKSAALVEKEVAGLKERLRAEEG